MRTLITGFGPFLGITDNPSERLARHFAAHGAPGHEVMAQVLPVSFARTRERLPALLKDGRFDAALLLGVDSGGSDTIRLERYGRNRARGTSPDADGAFPGDGPLAPGAPDALETALNVEGLRARLESAGVAARISEDAGGYVCNCAYFTALQEIAASRHPTRCLFVHVPPDTPACPLGEQLRAVRLILDALAEG